MKKKGIYTFLNRIVCVSVRERECVFVWGRERGRKSEERGGKIDVGEGGRSSSQGKVKSRDEMNGRGGEGVDEEEDPSHTQYTHTGHFTWCTTYYLLLLLLLLLYLRTIPNWDEFLVGLECNSWGQGGSLLKFWLLGR